MKVDGLKDSFNKGNRALLLGLAVLITSIGFSAWLLSHLGDAVRARKNSFEMRSVLNDIDSDVKNWAILMGLPDRGPELVDAIAKQSQMVEKDFERAIEGLATNPSQLKRLYNLRGEWHQLASHGDEFVRFDRLGKFGRNLSAVMQIERDKMDFFSERLTRAVNGLLLTLTFMGIVATFVIIYSVFSSAREHRRKVQDLDEMNRLKEDATNASALKSKFVATVSHEIRTPLNGIIGISDLLRFSSLPDRERGLVEVIHGSGKTLLRIINDILDFSKIESGRLELAKSNFNIVDVVRQVVFTLSVKAVEKNISLRIDLDPNLPQIIVGDSDRLTQILYNLLGNAIKFTTIGSVILRLKAVEANPSERSIRILFSIEDTGVGLAEADMKNLFKPFVQAHKAGTLGEAGTGLGLSISQHLVQAMGGRINVSSIPGSGSRFWFEIPFEYSTDLKVGLEQSTMPTMDRRSSEIEVVFDKVNKPKVLVVEDSQTNQVVAHAMLVKLGAEVVMASDGAEAIDLVKEHQFDLILMDCFMPKVDGFEATRAIRDAGLTVPIVALTANAAAEGERRCFEAGMNGFITKPITLKSLRSELVKLLPREQLEKVDVHAYGALEDRIGREAARKVFDIYIATLSELRSQLSKLSIDGDLEGLRRLGHKFKSSSLTVGATAFSNLCGELERSPSLADALDLGERLQKRSHSVESALQSAARDGDATESAPALEMGVNSPQGVY